MTLLIWVRNRDLHLFKLFFNNQLNKIHNKIYHFLKMSQLLRKIKLRWFRWRGSFKKKLISWRNSISKKYSLWSLILPKKRRLLLNKILWKFKSRKNIFVCYSSKLVRVLFKAKEESLPKNNMILSSLSFFRKITDYTSNFKWQEMKASNGGSKQDNYGHRLKQKVD